MLEFVQEEQLKDLKFKVKMFTGPADESSAGNNDKVWRRLNKLPAEQLIAKSDNKVVITMKKAKYVSPRVLGSAVVHPC